MTGAFAIHHQFTVIGRIRVVPQGRIHGDGKVQPSGAAGGQPDCHDLVRVGNKQLFFNDGSVQGIPAVRHGAVQFQPTGIILYFSWFHLDIKVSQRQIRFGIKAQHFFRYQFLRCGVLPAEHQPSHFVDGAGSLWVQRWVSTAGPQGIQVQTDTFPIRLPINHAAQGAVAHRQRLCKADGGPCISHLVIHLDASLDLLIAGNRAIHGKDVFSWYIGQDVVFLVENETAAGKKGFNHPAGVAIYFIRRSPIEY